MKTILVTGGAGFIGSNFVRHLLERTDYRVLVLDCLTYAGSIDNLGPGFGKAQDSDRFAFWYGNVRNGDLVDTLVRQSQIVVHFAAESHVTRSIYSNNIFFETDVLGTQTVANSVAKYPGQIELFVHISTSEVYGTAMHPLMDEDHPLLPMSPYASAKAGADRLIYSYWKTYGIPAVIVRPFNNYGPNQHLEKLIPRLITSALLDEPLLAHGDGSAERDWLYVMDHCEALLRLLECDPAPLIGEVINLGTGRSIPINTIATMVLEMIGDSKSSITYVADRPGQVTRHTSSTDKAARLLNWSAATPFDVGLRDTLEWYRANRPWWERQLWMRHIPIMTAGGKVELH